MVTVAAEEGPVALLAIFDLMLRNDVIETTQQEFKASIAVLMRMCRRDREATEGYYHRLLDKCRDMDSKLELSTSMDVAAEQAWTRYCKECTHLVHLRTILFDEHTGLEQNSGQYCKLRHCKALALYIEFTCSLYQFSNDAWKQIHACKVP
jgi:hypothetical protein